MTIKFNHHFFKDIDLYLWLMLGAWSLYDLCHDSATSDYVVDGVFLLTVVIALFFIVFKRSAK